MGDGQGRLVLRGRRRGLVLGLLGRRRGVLAADAAGDLARRLLLGRRGRRGPQLGEIFGAAPELDGEAGDQQDDANNHAPDDPQPVAAPILGRGAGSGRTRRLARTRRLERWRRFEFVVRSLDAIGLVALVDLGFLLLALLAFGLLDFSLSGGLLGFDGRGRPEGERLGRNCRNRRRRRGRLFAGRPGRRGKRRLGKRRLGKRGLGSRRRRNGWPGDRRLGRRGARRSGARRDRRQSRLPGRRLGTFRFRRFRLRRFRALGPRRLGLRRRWRRWRRRHGLCRRFRGLGDFRGRLAGDFGFHARNRSVERVGFARNVGFGDRRLDGLQLADQRLARPLVDRAPRIGVGVGEGSDRSRQKWIVIGHPRLRPFPTVCVNPGKGCGPGWYRRARGLSKAGRPARRSVLRYDVHI